MRRWFGPFRLERQVGRGGLGAVFRAIDSRTGATVALKMLPPGADPLALTRLRREFSALRALSHPNAANDIAKMAARVAGLEDQAATDHTDSHG